MHNGGGAAVLDPTNLDAFLTQVSKFVFALLYRLLFSVLVFKSNGRE
jgi:hypothetical protein